MGSRYKTKLVVKLFPSVPKGAFGGKRLTKWLEDRVFYREFSFSPWKLAFVALGLGALGAWGLASLGLAWHATHEADVLTARLADREARLAEVDRRLHAARRDYYVLLSSLEPLNEKVERLAEFSHEIAIVAGVEDLAREFGTTEAERHLDLRLTDREVAELEARFLRLGTFVEDIDTQLARTPSISPLKDVFVPTDRYGYRVSRFIRQGEGRGGTSDRRFHAGLDLAAPVGTPIHATADATVHFAGRIPAKQSVSAAHYGNFVVLDHGNGTRTVYAHCDALAVEAGDEVRRGDLIAWVGSTGRSTGPHLHYEVVVNGRPVDPELFVLDVEIPDRRVRVDFDEESMLLDAVDSLVSH